MKHFRPLSTRAAVRLCSACALVALSSSAQAIPSDRAPVSLVGGLRTGSISLNPSLHAFPIQSSVPIAGFQPFVATTLTNEVYFDDFDWYAKPSSNPAANTLPLNSNPRYSFFSTLDSGGQTHILSAEVASIIDLEGANRDGHYEVPISGAAGTETLIVSDPIGVYASGIQNVSGTSPLTVTSNSWRGQYNTSVLTASDDSLIPNIIGSPIFGQYSVSIRNSQTRRLEIGDTIVRSPAIQFHSMNSGPSQPLKLIVDLIDSNGASSTQPTFFPSIENIQNAADNPLLPTFWTFPFAYATVTGDDGQRTDQFLFDTGAQVTVLSEATADAIGIDVGTDTPDFYVEILGAGGLEDVPGYYVNHLHLNVIGGDIDYDNVPVLVLDLIDPRDGIGAVPGILGMNLFNDRDMTINLDAGDPYVKISQPMTAQWNVNASGNWSMDTNWSLGVPDGVELSANFLGAITAPKTITVDHDFTLGHMKFDNANSYTIAGAGLLKFETIVGVSQITVVNGSHTISAPMKFNPLGQEVIVSANNSLTISSDIDALDSDVTKFDAGQLNLKNARFKSLSIVGGTVKITAGAGNQSTSKVQTLSVSTASKLDLTDAKFIVAQPSALSVVRDDIAAQRIISSLNNSSRAVGYALAGSVDTTSFGGMTVSPTDLLIRMTLKGDSNLDGSVDFDDLLSVAQNYDHTGLFWDDGDFNYDSNVDFNDLLPIAQNYGMSLLMDGSMDFGSSMNLNFESDWSLARSMVPEPGALSLLMLSAVTLRRRR